MATPLAGIPTPTYGPGTWADLAAMAAALELLGSVTFPTEAARDAAHPNPREGQLAFVSGASGGLCVHTATGWQYLAYRTAEPSP